VIIQDFSNHRKDYNILIKDSYLHSIGLTSHLTVCCQVASNPLIIHCAKTEKSWRMQVLILTYD
jgi:hypothetical protein